MTQMNTYEKYPVIEINGEEEYSDSPDDNECDKSSSFYPGDEDQSDDLAYYKLRGRRRRWTQRDMTNAFNAVKYQGMSLRGAATSFNVPESTLRDRVHGRVSLDCSRPGPPTFFTYDEERKMVDHILFMSKIGYPFTRSQVVELAGDMTKAVGRIAPFKYINPSQAWFYAFLNRWPDLKNFLFGPRNNRKSRGVSGDSIQSYFEQLDKVLTKYNIKDKPEHIWVVDETSVSCENQPPRIIPIGIQRAQSTSYWSPSVSLIGAGCATGEKVPATLVFKGTSVNNAMMQGAVKDTFFTTSYSGWVTPDTFLQWFTKVFREKVYQRPLILFYDGHLQYISVRVLEQAREDGILLFPLPPHPAYNHCVENTCLWNYSQAFAKRVEKSLDLDRFAVLSRENISPVITHAYHIAMKPAKLQGLFEKLGVCPFNNLSQSIGAYLSVPDDESMTNDNFFDNQSVNGEVITDENDYQYPDTASMLSTASSTTASKQPILHLTPMPTDKFNSSWSYDEFSKKSFTSQMQQIMILRSQQQIGVPLSIKNRQPGVTKAASPGLQSTATMGKRSMAKVSPSVVSSTLPLKQTKPSFTEPDSSQAIDLDEDLNDSSEEKEVEISIPTNNQTDSTTTPTSVASKPASEPTPETPDFCIVCGRLEPPELNQKTSEESQQQVVDWTKCDFCNRWVHLYSFCSEDAVISEDSYMCSVCNTGYNRQPSEEVKS